MNCEQKEAVGALLTAASKVNKLNRIAKAYWAARIVSGLGASRDVVIRSAFWVFWSGNFSLSFVGHDAD